MKSRVVCIVVTLAGCISAQGPRRQEMVLSGETAYGLMSPDPVAGSRVSQILWSDSGNFLIALRTDVGPAGAVQKAMLGQGPPPEAETSIVVYDLRKRKASVVWSAKGMSESRIISLTCFHGADSALALIAEPVPPAAGGLPGQGRIRILIIDAGSATSRSVAVIDQEEGMPDLAFSPSPGAPAGVLTATRWRGPDQQASWAGRWCVVGPGGLSAWNSLDSGVYIAGWTPDGSSPVFGLIKLVPGTKPQRTQAVGNLASGAISPAPAGLKLYQEPEKKAPITLQPGLGAGTMGSTQCPTISAWLVGEGDEKAMVAGDVEIARLSPTLSAVAYVTQGVATVRPILAFPKDVYLKAKRAAEKSVAISNGKQVGLGLLMYSADHDDRLPLGTDDLGSLLSPYLKNRSVFEGFVYSFPGGYTSDIKEPATTALGYVPGPGGRAIVYADGHVVWKDDP